MAKKLFTFAVGIVAINDAGAENLIVEPIQAKNPEEALGILIVKSRCKGIKAYSIKGDSDQELIDILRGGKKIQAIKRAKDIHGFSLTEAKTYVENLDVI